MSTRILIADAHQAVLDGLAALVEAEAGLELAGRARDGRETVASALELTPDVAIVSLSLPGWSGIEATRRIVAARPGIRVVCLSMHRERQYVAAALEAGAAGYLLKDRVSERLAEAIRRVAEGGVYLCPEVRAGLGDPAPEKHQECTART